MTTLIGLPVILLIVMLQTAVVRTLPLLQGTADLVLLVVAAWTVQDRIHSDYTWAVMAGLLVGFIGKTPWFVPLIGYVAVAVLANFLRRQVWQTPLLAMFITTLSGSLLLLGLQWGAMRVQGVPLPIIESLNLVILPGALLNLLLALPVYALVTDLTQSVFPEEVVS
jgi:hypothetical protein